ncbi:unnamed protein product [Prunus armeniaca]
MANSSTFELLLLIPVRSLAGENVIAPALLLLLVPVPYIVVVGTSIVAPAYYGANIVAHAFAIDFLCLTLPYFFEVWLYLALPYFLGFGFCLIYYRAHMVSVFCLTYCRAHWVSVLCIIYCHAHRVSVFCLIYCRAHRVSVFCYVPYFLGFALVFPLRILL